MGAAVATVTLFISCISHIYTGGSALNPVLCDLMQCESKKVALPL